MVKPSAALLFLTFNCKVDEEEVMGLSSASGSGSGTNTSPRQLASPLLLFKSGYQADVDINFPFLI